MAFLWPHGMQGRGLCEGHFFLWEAMPPFLFFKLSDEVGSGNPCPPGGSQVIQELRRSPALSSQVAWAGIRPQPSCPLTTIGSGQCCGVEREGHVARAGEAAALLGKASPALAVLSPAAQSVLKVTFPSPCVLLCAPPPQLSTFRVLLPGGACIVSPSSFHLAWRSSHLVWCKCQLSASWICF